MGYSELMCHICGVTFTIGRRRTLKEVQTLDPDSTKPEVEFLLSYIMNARANLWKCDNTDQDCLVFIPPKKRAFGGNHGAYGESKKQGTDTEDDTKSDDGVDMEYVDTSSEISEPYEFQSPDDSTAEGDGDVEMTDSDASGNELDSTVDQRLWQREMWSEGRKEGTIRPYIHWRIKEEQQKKQGGNEPDVDDGYLEHIPGPKCSDQGGYYGSRISLAELRGCTVAQVLVPKPSDWTPAADDEPFERGADFAFFLSGLADDVPSRDCNYPSCFPERHGMVEIPADNYHWTEEQKSDTGMPFHPTCLEVFKRASLHRSGRIDFRGLMDWYRLEATYELFWDFPRAAAVARGNDQWWRHIKGDEHIVANPCYVPKWEVSLASGALSTKPSEDPYQGVFDVGSGAPSKDKFSRFSADIRLRVLTHLVSDAKDIANLRLASRTFRQLPQLLFRFLLLHRRPWLWEAWCSLPYSFWTTTSGKALKRAETAMLERQESIIHSITVLKEEANDRGENSLAIRALEVQLEEVEVERRNVRRDAPVPQLSKDDTNWHAIYMGFCKPKPKWPRGLRNRRRIWKDCGHILDRIEKGRNEGKIGPPVC